MRYSFSPTHPFLPYVAPHFSHISPFILVFETFGALLLLLCFALVSSAHVFQKGLEAGNRTTHELLLRCVIIITSVVPRHLPMQMAMAVNTAMMALLRAGIFVTEPFRLPLAGKVDSVYFDKTGTLTSDQLVPVGVINSGEAGGQVGGEVGGHVGGHAAGHAAGHAGGHVGGEVPRSPPSERPVKEASSDAALVLAGCHSLVSVGGAELVGDPIELAALEGIEWSYAHIAQTATPGHTASLERAIAALKAKLAPPPPPPAPPPPAAEGTAAAATAVLPTALPPLSEAARAEAEAALATAEAALAAAEQRRAQSHVRSVRIVHRHHFSSALQRMSTVATVLRAGSSEPSLLCLVKGSPEALRPLLAAGGAPEWYEAAYRSLAERGMRVLALAFKSVPAGTDEPAAASMRRESVESELTFAGFVAFACKTRADSPTVVRALLESAHACFMLTGDAPLTALHVARECGICASDKPELLLTESPSLRWVRALGVTADVTVAPFDASRVAQLAREYELMATDAAIEAAAEASGGAIWDLMDSFKVFFILIWDLMDPFKVVGELRAYPEPTPLDPDLHPLPVNPPSPHHSPQNPPPASSPPPISRPPPSAASAA